jgi:hypothetical protein
VLEVVAHHLHDAGLVVDDKDRLHGISVVGGGG